MDYSQYPSLEYRRRFWKFFGAEIKIYPTGSEQLVGFIKLKAFKLRENIKFFADETQTREIFEINARNIIDFGATYDVTDTQSGQAIFSIRRKGLRSTFVRDTWEIYDSAGTIYGLVQETSSNLAIMRRYLDFIPLVGDISSIIFMFIPQTYSIYYTGDGGQRLGATIIHKRNPFLVRMQLDMAGKEIALDPRISMATSSLLSVIDASKNS